MILRAGELLYIPSQVYIYRFDDETPGRPVDAAWPLTKPTSVLLLKNEEKDNNWLQILYNGENVYVDKHDIKNYQEL